MDLGSRLTKSRAPLAVYDHRIREQVVRTGIRWTSRATASCAEAAAVPQAAAGALATRVEVGKNLTDRVYVGYSRIFGAGENENSNEGRFEYRMSRRWVLQSEYGDAGVGGFDLMWTTRY